MFNKTVSYKMNFKREWVAHVDDERDLDHGIIVTLAKGWFFKDSPEGVRGYDTMREAREDTKRTNVEFKG